MSDFLNENKESGKDWARRKGYLTNTPKSLKDIEEQKKREFIEAYETKRKEKNERFSEVLNTINQPVQSYYCPVCQSTVVMWQNYCTTCGTQLLWQ